MIRSEQVPFDRTSFFFFFNSFSLSQQNFTIYTLFCKGLQYNNIIYIKYTAHVIYSIKCKHIFIYASLDLTHFKKQRDISFLTCLWMHGCRHRNGRARDGRPEQNTCLWVPVKYYYRCGMLSTGRQANNHEQLNPTLLHGARIFFSSACNHVFRGGGCTWMHKAFIFTYRLCYKIQIAR